MPALHSVGLAALEARELFDSEATSSITPKSVLLIIFIAVVPVLVVAGLVGWLLFGYSRGGGCCGGRKDKGDDGIPTPAAPQVATEKDREVAAFLRPSPDQNPPYSPLIRSTPARPASAHMRNDSGMSKGSGNSGSSMNEKRPAVPRGFV